MIIDTTANKGDRTSIPLSIYKQNTQDDSPVAIDHTENRLNSQVEINLDILMGNTVAPEISKEEKIQPKA